MHGPPSSYSPQLHFQQPPHPHDHLPQLVETKGQDPLSNDMSNTKVCYFFSHCLVLVLTFKAQALAKNFGVNASILGLASGVQDNEDLAVGSGGLSSGRDRRINEASLPRDSSRWQSVNLPRNRVENTTTSMSPPQPSIKIWLPKDRKMVKYIVSVYFSRLNYNRPALDQPDFEQNLNTLYDGQITARHDQGFICTLYLVLALGTLNEVNHRVNQKGKDGITTPADKAKMMPEGWPEHGEFFDWGLFYKPEIQATISALQSLVLLHWYLYTEVSWEFISVLQPSNWNLATRTHTVASCWQPGSSCC